MMDPRIFEAWRSACGVWKAISSIVLAQVELEGEHGTTTSNTTILSVYTPTYGCVHKLKVPVKVSRAKSRRFAISALQKEETQERFCKDAIDEERCEKAGDKEKWN